MTPGTFFSEFPRGVTALLPTMYRIEVELQAKDASAVQHWQQPQAKHGGALRREGHAGAEEDVEMDGEGVQLVAQSGAHGPAVLRRRRGPGRLHGGPKRRWL